MNARLSCSVVAMFLCACSSKTNDGPASASANVAAPSASPSAKASASPAASVSAGDLTIADGPLEVRVGSATVTYKSAILIAPFGASVDGDKKFFDRNFHVRLSSSEDLSCEKSDTGSDYIDIPLGPGDDGKFFAGRTVSNTLTLYAEAFKAPTGSNGVWVDAPFVRIELGAFTLSDPSFQLGLGIRQSKKANDKPFTVAASGRVTVKICAQKNAEVFAGTAATRVDPPRTEGVAGTVAGKPFESKTALAFVERDELNGVDVVSSVNFYATETTCDVAGQDLFSGAGYQGIVWSILRPPLTSKNRLLGVATPLSLSGGDIKISGGRFSMGSLSFANTDSGWVRFDEASLDDGGTIRGAFVADSGPLPSSRSNQLGRIDGTFTAKVCPMKKK